MDFKTIKELILKYDTITIFRHIRPDGDAAGSQLGLLTYLKDNFPLKKIYALGTETYDVYPYLDETSDEIIKDSLAIILDTSTKDRVDDKRYLLAKETLKIDHHPPVDNFADHNFVKEESAATCEFLCDILSSEVFKDLVVSKKAAEYLYSGLLTDTIGFKTASVSANTIKAAYFLCEKGIDIYELNTRVFDVSEHIFKYCSYMRHKSVFEDGLAYAIINDEDLRECNIEAKVARNYVAQLGGVKEHRIWALLTQNEKGTDDGSLRSQRAYIVNEIAQRYNGGGHANASGVKELTLDQVNALINELKNLIYCNNNNDKL